MAAEPGSIVIFLGCSQGSEMVRTKDLRLFQLNARDSCCWDKASIGWRDGNSGKPQPYDNPSSPFTPASLSEPTLSSQASKYAHTTFISQPCPTPHLVPHRPRFQSSSSNPPLNQTPTQSISHPPLLITPPAMFPLSSLLTSFHICSPLSSAQVPFHTLH